MEAKVLLCNWCRAKGKAEFATVPIEVRVGGLKAKTYRLDGCAHDSARFERILHVGTGVTGKTPKKPGSVPGIVRVPALRVEAAALRALRSLAPDAWRVQKEARATVERMVKTTRHQFASATRRLIERKMIESRRIEGTNAHELRLTAAGRAAAKNAQPESVLAKIAPVPPAPEHVKFAMLRYIAKGKDPAYGPDLYGTKEIPGVAHAKKKALVALRGEGFVHMAGSKRNARYTVTPKGKAKVQTTRAPVAAATSAPSEKRAARRLRSPRRRHRR
jgi:DNA-binding MarR family transcriptional regulator